ncbi:hypothetical protein ACEQ8H_003075 [Pleosporales sp. CAS-2024a]
MAPTLRRLKIAVSGLGRMGARHANHFLHRTPRAELVAAFTPAEKELAWAKENLEPWGVNVYSDYDDMLQHQGLEAVCVATVTTAHVEQSIKAIEAGLHVLCEKPLSTNLEVQKVMCGFSRRFDSSYLSAYSQTTNGSIGRPTILCSQTCDKYDPTGFFVEYAQFSGGIFVDCNIHDIDLALWFFSAETHGKTLPKVKRVVAFGVTAVEPGLATHGDVDNGVAVVEFYAGQIAYFYSSRMNPPGQHDSTDIIGTKGKLCVNANPATGLLESHRSTGIHRDIPQNYYPPLQTRFFHLASSIEAVKIAVALQDSLKTGNMIVFGQDGNRLEHAGAAQVRSKL